MIKKSIIITLLIFVSSFYIYTQEDLIESLDLDSLFELQEEDSSIDDDQTDNMGDFNVLNDLLDSESFIFNADYKLYGAITTGAEEYSLDFVDNLETLPILSMESTLSLKANLSSDLSIYQEVEIEYPDFDFELTEFFADAIINDMLFLRMGKQSITWGESRSFSFTDLPSRVSDDWDTPTYDYLSFNLNFPINLGSLNLLIHTPEDSWEEAGSDGGTPSLDDLGAGVKFNYVQQLNNTNIDFNIGSYYHSDLLPRLFLSGKSTLFNGLEAYSEVLFTLDEDLQISYNLGLYNSFLKDKLTIGLEYYYNDEESESDVNSDFLLLENYNFAFYSKYSMNKLTYINYLYFNYASSDDYSGIVTPVLNYDISNNIILSLSSTFIFGNSEEGYYDSISDTLVREYIIALRLIFYGSL